jgi:anti-sigma B factor antagonist
MFQQTKQGEIVTVKVRTPHFNAAVAPEFKRLVGDLAARGEKHIVVDLAAIEFIDSTALGALVSGLKTVAPGGQIAVCNANVNVEAMLRITRMDRILKSYSDEAAAREALQAVAG